MTTQEWLNNEELPITIWEKKYRNGDENFEQWLDRVSGGSEVVKDLIREQKFIFGGRILANRGINDRKITLSNCYVVTPPEDNLESIFDAGRKLARTFSYGGGCGLDVSNLRPKGANVNNAAKSTSGATSFMDFYSYVTGLIGQEGRRGATMLSISCEHPDLVEFINLKSNLDVCTKANISVRMTDAFMQAVEADSDFTLHFTMEDGSTITKVINAKEVFLLLAKRNWEMAEPGILYWDRIANYNLLQDSGFKYAGVNPCFSGNMKLLTAEGNKTFEELCGRTDIPIVNANGNVTKGKVWQSGVKKTVRVQFGRYKRELVCTPDHRFMLSTGEECFAKDLKGKYIMPCTKRNSHILNPRMVLLGFIQGDGQLADLSEHSEKRGVTINIGTKDHDIYHLLDGLVYSECQNGRSVYLTDSSVMSELHAGGFSTKQLPERTFPTAYPQWSLMDKASFLHGCYSANGSVIRKGRIAYKTTCKQFAEELKSTLVNDFGLSHAYITINKKHDVQFFNGAYPCKESYDVNLSNLDDIVSFINQIGFYQHYKSLMAEEMLHSRPIYVNNVVEGDCIPVYDFTEPECHWGIVESCVVHNCAEEPLPAGGSCLLGSLNLSKFVINPFTETAQVDFGGLSAATKQAVIALNDVLIEGLPLHPLQEQRESVHNWKQIGLGTLGLGDMLIMLGKRYGSEESLNVIEEVYKCIAASSVVTSLDLAKEHGAFAKCDDAMKQSIADSDFVRNLGLYETIVEDIKQYGLFNSQLLTCAPTGTIGTMLQVSTGVEPNFAFSYNRRTVSLNNEETTYKVDTKIVDDYKKATGATKLPSYFVASADIHYDDRIAVQAMLQRYIDASISSTVNLPNSVTVEDVANIYMKAWKAGLKGITIWRDGCQRQAILSTGETNNIENEPENQPMKHPGYDTILPISRKEIGITNGSTFCKKCACGTLYVTVNRDTDGNIVEVFTHTSKGGVCAANTNGLTRMISLALRSGVSVNEIKDQLHGITCLACLKLKAQGKQIDGISCPDILSKTIDEFQAMYSPILRGSWAYTKEQNVESLKCPECGEPIAMTEGCMTCASCGYSKCS